MIYNKVYAQLGEERHIVLDPVNYQYDVKQILVISGETVPEYYEADICNVGDTATLTMIGTAADGVEIPDRFFRDGRNVLVYVVIPGSGGDVQTRYDITIPSDERGERTDIELDTDQQTQADSLIAALNSGVGRAEAAAEAIQDMDVEAKTLAAGSAASVEKTVDPETGAVTLNFGIPQGQKGNPGTPGQDGVTPDFRIGSVETLNPGQSATATITGTPAKPVLNLGIPQGQKGDPGGDSGTSDYTELENKPQINGHTLDGNRSASDLELGTYSKPASGIPKTDLASDVQTSLGKADSALQTAPVQSVAGKTGAVTLGAGDVGFSSSEEYNEGTVGAKLSELNRQLSDLADTVSTTQIINSASGAIASFDDGADAQPIRKLVANIEPVQDLHGQDAPYPAGGGKNKFLADFENQTVNNTTYTLQSDGKVTTSGVPSSATNVVIGHVFLPAGTYVLNGCPANGGSGKYRLQVTDYPIVNNLGQDEGNGIEFTISTGMEVAVRIQMYTGAPSSLTFAPMIRLSSVSDSTFAPYSNICPISGHTGAEIVQAGKNILDESSINTAGRILNNGSIGPGFNSWWYGFVRVDAGKTYTLSGLNTNTGAHTYMFDASMNPVRSIGQHQNVTVTVQTGEAYIGISLQSAERTTAQLELGSTATAFEEYRGNQISVNWEDEAGTVYGGSATYNGDGTWTLIGERLFNERVLSTYTSKYDGDFIAYGLADFFTENVIMDGAICNVAPFSYSSLLNLHFYVGNNNTFLNIFLPRGTDESLVIQGCAKLSTPHTYTITTENLLRTLYGTNNIWTDVGTVDVEYPADTKLYIDGKIAEAIAALQS